MGFGQPRFLPIHLLAFEPLFVDVALPCCDDGRPLTGMRLLRRHIVDPRVVVFSVVPRHIGAEVGLGLDVILKAIRRF